ncbi:hypothetical protein CULT_2420003 [[Clostridium] ultunense Esp]|nr:hypothetical protein CULT_2420003 [[Clostridium] ultunense Esp]
MKREKQIVPVFTLGLSGCKAFGIKEHYWIDWGYLGHFETLFIFELYRRLTGAESGPTSCSEADDRDIGRKGKGICGLCGSGPR